MRPPEPTTEQRQHSPDETTSTSEDRAPLITVAGWTGIALGAGHLISSGFATRHIWREVIREGWWQTFTLDQPTTLRQAERSEAFWGVLGSFAVPSLLLGVHLTRSARRGTRVPAWLGWALIGWGVPLGAALPKSPVWAVPLMGGLIIANDREASLPSHRVRR